MSWRIVETEFSEIAEYESVPIAFEAASRLDLGVLQATGELVEVGVPPFSKDYDSLERPSTLPSRFDVSNWTVLAAFDGETRVGGAIVAWKCPGLDMLEGRDDVAIIWDIRVAPAYRGRGLGKALFLEAAVWARSRGCEELRVETQDNNVAACRFYAAMGCRFHSAEPNAYGPDCNEGKFIWTRLVTD